MLGHSHMLVGVSGLIVAEAAAHAVGVQLVDSVPIGDVQVSSGALLVAATAIGALAPDIDHPNAFLANFKFGGAWLGGVVGLLLGAILAGQPCTGSGLCFAKYAQILPMVFLILGVILGRSLLRGVRIKALKGVAVIAGEVAGHRKFFHSIIATLLAGLAAAFLLVPMGLPFVAFAFTWGYLSHLAADSMTRSGVPWLWPKSKPYGIPRSLRFTTGTAAEYFVVALAVGAAGLAVLSWGVPGVTGL